MSFLGTFHRISLTPNDMFKTIIGSSMRFTNANFVHIVYIIILNAEVNVLNYIEKS